MINRIFYAPKTSGLTDPMYSLETVAEGFQLAADDGVNLELPLSALQQEAELELSQDGFSGVLAVHAGLSELNPVSADALFSGFSRNRYEEAIRLAEQYGARYLIFHMPDHTPYTLRHSYKSWFGRMTGFLEQLLNRCLEQSVPDPSNPSQSNLTILLENHRDNSPETLSHLLSRLNSPLLQASLNTGRINLHSGVTAIDWLDALSPHVAYVQLNNNNGQADEYVPLDAGALDMPSFLNHLTLLTIKPHVSIATAEIPALRGGLEMLRPYLKIQQEQCTSKSFLV